MCQIVKRAQIVQWLNKTEYLVFRNGRCTCIRPADHLKCSKATQLPEPSQLSRPVSPSLTGTLAIDSVC